MNVEGQDLVLRFSADTKSANTSLTRLAKNLGTLREALSGFDDVTVKKLTHIADAIERIGKFGGNIRGLTTELKKLGGVKVNPVKESLKGVAAALTDLQTVESSRSLGWFSDVLNDVGKASRIAWGGIKSLAGSAWNSLKKNVKSAAKSFNSFLSSIGRIAMYRAIRAAIKMISEGFREGIQNAYFWAKEVGNQFATSMDMIKTSTLYLKNSLGAMVAPLINQIAPVIDFIIDRFVDLLNIINQVFALLGGQSTYFRALKYPAEYMEDIAGSTAKARKELELWIASFDELNIIPNQKDRNRGSGAGDQLDYGSMFEEVALTNPLKDAIENGDWEGLGRLLADKINSLVFNADFGGIGTAIGRKIGGLIDTLYGFMDELDFSQIGQKFGELVTNALNNINWKNVGKLKVRKWTALIDLVVGFLGGLNWSTVGKAFGDTIRGVLEGALDWIKRIDWSEMGKKLISNLSDFISGLDFGSIATTFFTLLGNVFLKLGDFLFGVISQAITEAFPNLAKFLGLTGENAGEKFDEGLEKGFQTASTNIEKVYVPGVGKIMKRSVEDLGTEEGKTVVTNFSNGLATMPKAVQVINPALDDIEKRLKEFSDNVDKTFGKPRTMKLSVDVDRVTVPKFTVYEDNISGINFPVINARKYNIPMAYAEGGFPEDGLFFANHGELVGKFSNGQTAVANNEQIIEGIKRGVAEGMASNGNSGNIYLKANLDGKVLFDAVCDRITEYVMQTGTAPFPV